MNVQAERKTRQQRKTWNRLRQSAPLYLLLAPAVIVFLIFTYAPMYGVIIAFNSLILGLSIRQTPLEVFAIPFGSWYLTASRETLLYSIRVFVTAMAAVSCLYFLSCSTPMTDILQVLKKLKCPKLLIELMLLIYRYIFVLLDCAHSISIAQKSRLGNISFRQSLRSFGQLVSALFIQAVRRSGRLYDAMESRCYDGDIRVLSENRPPKKAELALILFFELFLLAMTVIVRCKV